MMEAACQGQRERVEHPGSAWDSVAGSLQPWMCTWFRQVLCRRVVPYRSRRA